MNASSKYLLVPVDLMLFAMLKRLAPEIRLFLYFKFVASGHLTYSNSLLQMASKELGISDRTVRRHLNTLLRLKFLTYNNRSKSLRTVSFLSLAKRNGFTSQYGVIMNKKHLHDFRLFAFSTCIGHELKKFKRVVMSQRSPELIKGRSSRRSEPAQTPSLSIPVTVISRKLNISPSAASSYKNASAKLGLLSVKKNYNPLKIPSDHIPYFKHFVPEEAKKVRMIKGEYFIQEADHLISNLKFKRRRNFRKIV